MSEAIQCTGNELPEVLAGLRANNRVPWALEVVGNSGYSVEYFSGGNGIGRDSVNSPKQTSPDVAGAETSLPGDAAVVSPKAAPAPLCSFCGAELSSDGTCEICARLWAIREKAAKNRKLFKPKRNDHARLPHND